MSEVGAATQAPMYALNNNIRSEGIYLVAPGSLHHAVQFPAGRLLEGCVCLCIPVAVQHLGS